MTVSGINSASQPKATSSSYGTAMRVVETGADMARIWSSNAQEEEKVRGTIDRVGLAVADYYTFGLASHFYGWANKQWGGTMDKIRKFDSKYNIGTIILNKIFDTDKWKTEGNRLKKLQANGIQIPEEFQGRMYQQRGMRKEELIDRSVPLDFVGYKENGIWVNNKFTLSRNEKDLHPQDICGYAAFFEKFGNQWSAMNEGTRTVIAQKALDLGCVREHHGTTDVRWTPELEAFAAEAMKSPSQAHEYAKATNGKLHAVGNGPSR